MKKKQKPRTEESKKAHSEKIKELWKSGKYSNRDQSYRTKEELVELYNHRSEQGLMNELSPKKITIDDVMEIKFYDEFEAYDIWVNN